MVVRGVYTKAEKQMLADFRANTDRQVGWLGEVPSEQVPYPVSHRVASKDLILHMACAADYWNPLWRDEGYARNTRWGTIIAPPFFQHCISHGGSVYFLKVTPEVGSIGGMILGEYWEFFKPIYINDSFRVWVGPPRVEDVTPPAESAERRFKVMGEVSYINQRGELTGILRRRTVTRILPPGVDIKKKRDVKFTREYVYAKEDISAIDRMADAEEIRGGKPRYWEDVNTGDELKPVVMGPTTPWDEVVEMQGFGVGNIPTREVRKQTPERIVIDPVTNIPHKSIEVHLTEGTARALGAYSTSLIVVTVEHFLGRLITNWMGDDGFLRRLDLVMLSATPIGDAIFGRGRVTRKYVDDDGNHLVDLDVWMESVRGFVPNAATATVSLLSKEKAFA